LDQQVGGLGAVKHPVEHSLLPFETDQRHQRHSR
jgi:hypothetical protein